MPKPWTASKGMSTDRLPFAVANMTALIRAMALKSLLASSCCQAGHALRFLETEGRAAGATVGGAASRLS